MDNDDKYNGWRNYATWRINLELIDDYVSSTVYDDRETAERWSTSDLFDIKEELAEYADEAVTNFGENEDSLAVSYARAFMSDVDWYEIAEHAQAQAKEALAYTEKEA